MQTESPTSLGWGGFKVRLPKNYIQDEVAATKIVNKNHLETVNIEFSDIQ